MNSSGATSAANGDESALFEAALRLQGPARRAFLQQACSGDSAMLLRMLTLVAAHEKDADFLATAVVDGRQLEPFPSEIPASPPSTEEFAGRFKLLEKIGEGGCGEVYVAEQILPVRRRVALKLIKLGMDTKSVIARFEAERQALALMDHPNIARVLDAGATSLGRPFFVMELVRGVKITEYCDTNRLDIAQRLELFAKVCHAIQHAHQKGIIHRDIKPSNILVTLHDGVPVPKVIDFGIAKATEGRLTDATLYTQLQQFIGTPAYMSPEQAEMSGLDIDTRTDVYSLGVLLYELLTGRTPFDAKELVNQGIDQMRKIIREVEPKRPSTRLSTMEGAVLATTAEAQRTLAPQLIRRVQGDLDWIVMKCLEKDRTRRYETANGLASDIHRHLNNEPVVARPPSAAYRFGKAYRRNRGAFAAIGAVALALVIGIIAATWQAILANRAREAAMASDRQSKASEQRALQAEADQTVLRKQADQQAFSAKRVAYNSDMLLASRALSTGDARLANDLLERNRPEAKGPDFRDWEWRYLKGMILSDPYQTIHRGPRSFTWDQRLAFGGPNHWLVATDLNGFSVRDLNSSRIVYQRDSGFMPCFSPDGARLYFGVCRPNPTYWSRNFALMEVEPATGRERMFQPTRIGLGSTRLNGKHLSLGLWNLLASPNGRALFSTATLHGGQHAVSRWDVATGEEEWQCRFQIDPSEHGSPAAISPDGKLLIAPSDTRGQIVLLDSETGDRRLEVTVSTGTITAVCFSPDSTQFLIGSDLNDGTIRVFDVKDGAPSFSLAGHRAWISALQFDATGRRLYSSSGDQTVRIWNWSERKPQRILRGHADQVLRMAVSPDGSRVASHAKDGSTFVWDLGRDRRKSTHQILAGEPIMKVIQREQAMNFFPEAAFTEDNRNLVAITSDEQIQTWSATTGELGRRPFASRTNLYFRSLSPNGRFAYAVQDDSSDPYHLFDLETMKEIPWFIPTNRLWWVNLTHRNLALICKAPGAASPEGQPAEDAVLEIWDLVGRRKVAEKSTGRSFQAFGYAPNPPTGKSAAVTTIPDPGCAWLDLSRPNPFQSPIYRASERENQIVTGRDFSSDLTRSISTQDDGSVALWNATKNQRQALRKAFQLTSQSCAYMPGDKRFIASGNGTETLKLFDADSGDELLALEGLNSGAIRLIPSPNGRSILALTDEGRMHLWTAPTLVELAQAEADERVERERDEKSMGQFYVQLFENRGPKTELGCGVDMIFSKPSWLQDLLYDLGRGDVVIRAMKPTPAIASDDDVHSWTEIAALQTLYRLRDDYEGSLPRLLELTEKSDRPVILERSATVFAMSPHSQTNLLERALRMAQRAVELGKDRDEMPSCLLARGLLEYRLGRHEEADATLRQCSNERIGHVPAIAAIFRALNAHARGRRSEAAELADRVREQWKVWGLVEPPADFKLHSQEPESKAYNTLLAWSAYRELTEALSNRPSPANEAKAGRPNAF